MEISLIILTYNRPDALEVILQSILEQKVLPGEVIIADDGSGPETKKLIGEFQTSFPIPLKHVWHNDDGFRTAAIRNSAVKCSEGEFLIFSDGDLVLHPCFISDFKKQVIKNSVLIGSRVFLTAKSTREILYQKKMHSFPSFFSPAIEKNRLNSIRIPTINKFFEPVGYSNQLRGGLLGVWKSDLISVNGWNEEFEGWGLEDTELISRLFNADLTVKKVKFCCLTYHLWHKQLNRSQIEKNKEILSRTLTNKSMVCPKGISNLE